MTRKRIINDEEKALWKMATQNDVVIEKKHAPPVIKRKKRITINSENSTGSIFQVSSYNYNQPTEAKLDLHGMNSEVAHSLLVNFIKQNAKMGNRSLLVITGKGSGVLREAVPLWLDAPTLRSYIASCSIAPPKQGGTGAYIVLLKRKKDA